VKLIGIDPGVTTGWASYDTERESSLCGECGGFQDVRNVLDAYLPDAVILEEYRLYPWKAKQQSWSNIPAAEVSGIVDLWCRDHGVVLCKQTPGLRKAVPNVWLKALGLWKPTKGRPHARDAAKHLASYIAKYHRDVLKIALSRATTKENTETACITLGGGGRS